MYSGSPLKAYKYVTYRHFVSVLPILQIFYWIKNPLSFVHN